MSISNSERIRNLNEKYEDDLFGLIMNEAAEKEGRLLFEEANQLKNESEPLPSKEDAKRFSNLLDSHMDKVNKVESCRRGSRLLKKIAVIMIVIVLAFSAMMVTVKAFRLQVLNFFVDPKYTSVQLNEDENLMVSWTNDYVPTYVPKDYEVAGTSHSDAINKIVFKKPDNSSIIYTEYKSTSSIAVDTEGASLIETVKINGRDGTLTIKDSMTAVVWSINDHIFLIQGTISKDEAVKIAEGIKFVK